MATATAPQSMSTPKNKISLAVFDFHHQIKSSLCSRCSRKGVTTDGAHLGDLVLGQHSSEETLQRWRVVGDIVSNLTDPGIVPPFFRNVLDNLLKIN